jgi:acyl-CoA thioester hydrolase
MTKRRRPKLIGRHLEHTTEVSVRFEEVDSLRVVWHGHYLSYFEDARVAFGRRYGIDYTDTLEAGFAVPIVYASIDYHASARYGDVLDVIARLYWVESAKLLFGYEVRRHDDGELLATGETVQVFTELEGHMCLVIPQFMKDFYARWDGEARTT